MIIATDFGVGLDRGLTLDLGLGNDLEVVAGRRIIEIAIIDTTEDLKTEAMIEIENTIQEEEIQGKGGTIDHFPGPGQNINHLKINKYVILLFNNVSLSHINKSELKSVLYIKIFMI